jgi:hypothetical protein
MKKDFLAFMNRGAAKAAHPKQGCTTLVVPSKTNKS